jgi:hypothetical protein
MTKDASSKHALGVVLLTWFSLSSAASTAVAEDLGAPWLPKGRTAWGVSGALGFADGSRAGRMGALSLVMNRTLTDPVGPGWLRGRMRVVVEIVPLFLLPEESTAYGAGSNCSAGTTWTGAEVSGPS